MSAWNSLAKNSKNTQDFPVKLPTSCRLFPNAEALLGYWFGAGKMNLINGMPHGPLLQVVALLLFLHVVIVYLPGNPELDVFRCVEKLEICLVRTQPKIQDKKR